MGDIAEVLFAIDDTSGNIAIGGHTTGNKPFLYLTDIDDGECEVLWSYDFESSSLEKITSLAFYNTGSDTSSATRLVVSAITASTQEVVISLDPAESDPMGATPYIFQDSATLTIASDSDYNSVAVIGGLL